MLLKMNTFFFSAVRLAGLAAVVLLLPFACGKGEDANATEKYEKALAAGKASTERTDKIFLDIRLGMRPREFFDHCTHLNQQKIITEGSAGNTVRYAITQLKHPATLNFFPKFTKAEEGKAAQLYAMDMEFVYDAWSPWNKELYSLNLLKDVTRMFVDWYGNDFVAVPHPQVGRVVVQVKNNRRTAFWIVNDSTVRGRIVDISQAPDEPLLPTAVESPVFNTDSLSVQRLENMRR